MGKECGETVFPFIPPGPAKIFVFIFASYFLREKNIPKVEYQGERERVVWSRVKQID